MAKAHCHYCECEASPRNLLRIETLPGFDGVVNVCNLCFIGEYTVDKAGKQAVLIAEAMLAGENGNDAFFEGMGRGIVARAAFGLI